MKKIILIMMHLTALCMQGVNAQVATLALHHQGEVAIFGAQQAQDALNMATDGDTLYLSAGVFSSDFTITKKVSIIGTGMRSLIGGNVSIAPPDSTTFTSCVLQNLYIKGTLTIDKPVYGVGISQCRFNHIIFNAAIDNSYIERCKCDGSNPITIYGQSNAAGSFWLSSNIKGLTVIASQISNVNGGCDNAHACNFVNCTIDAIWPNNSRNCCLATYENCIIRKFGTQEYNRLTTYIDCLCGTTAYTNSVNQGCWTNENISFEWDDDGMIYVTFNDGSALENYTGTDGTVVGCTGSSTPFTLVSAIPQVLEHTLEVNEQGTELKVTLKVGKE